MRLFRTLAIELHCKQLLFHANAKCLTVQVMYMYYFLGYKLWFEQRRLSDKAKRRIADKTFLLALDGDVDFDPLAMSLLVDLMKRDKNVGAACGRIHPTGSGLVLQLC